MDQTKRIDAASFPCSGCGGRMEFDPDSQQLACAQCGRRQVIESPALEAPEYLYNPSTDEYTAPKWDTMDSLTVRCNGCGAQTVVSAAAVTARCPFCGSNYVVNQDSVHVGILPETIMPFKVSRKRAMELFRKWVKSRFWAPGRFKKSSLSPQTLNGVYLPFWTFDACLQTSYSGEGGKTYTTTHTRTVNGKVQTYTTTHVRWYPISGNKELQFDDEKVCAVRESDDAMLNRLGDFNTKTLNRYHPAYLAGFFARRYDVGLGEGFGKARPSMEGQMEGAIRNDYSYDQFRNMRYGHNFSNVRFKHILLPIWISSYQYKKKVYRFLINGETGRISGKAPVSAVRIALAVLIACALALGLFLFFNSLK